MRCRARGLNAVMRRSPWLGWPGEKDAVGVVGVGHVVHKLAADHRNPGT